jgi:hypothetical protein
MQVLTPVLECGVDKRFTLEEYDAVSAGSPTRRTWGPDA